MILRPLVVLIAMSACSAGGAETLVASNPEEACEIEASLLVGLPVSAVNAISSRTENGATVYLLDLSGGKADCVIGPDGRVVSIELR